MKATTTSGKRTLRRSFSELGSSNPRLWLGLAIGMQFLAIVGAAARPGGTTASVIVSSLIGVLLLWLVGRGIRWAWYLFVTLELVGLALIPIFFVMVEVMPGGDLVVDPISVVTSLVALWLVWARSVRPHTRSAARA